MELLLDHFKDHEVILTVEEDGEENEHHGCFIQRREERGEPDATTTVLVVEVRDGSPTSGETVEFPLLSVKALFAERVELYCNTDVCPEGFCFLHHG